MKIVKQSWDWVHRHLYSDILSILENAGRTCYQSEPKGNPREFVRKIISRGHESVIEHVSLGVRIITDRGVTHELVRHRLASYSQESTRYCNYSKDRFGNEITVILPVWCDLNAPSPAFDRWRDAMLGAEEHYFWLLQNGWTPQQARCVLPNSLKTEIVMTANLREWRHFFRLRSAKAAHPQMRALAADMLSVFKTVVPVVFDDITAEV